jgi:hypothetical protein
MTAPLEEDRGVNAFELRTGDQELVKVSATERPYLKEPAHYWRKSPLPYLRHHAANVGEPPAKRAGLRERLGATASRITVEPSKLFPGSECGINMRQKTFSRFCVCMPLAEQSRSTVEWRSKRITNPYPLRFVTFNCLSEIRRAPEAHEYCVGLDCAEQAMGFLWHRCHGAIVLLVVDQNAVQPK